MEKIRGVNLGNWLVLEKWMNPSLFEGTDAEDEYYLPRRLSKEEYEGRIKTHRREYITERDFVTIKSWGLNAVRIPVPYFIFGDREPFIGCVEELDKAFNWAEAYDLKILIDLHTAPLSQNGFDNGGISGICKWAQTPEEVDFVLTVLDRLSRRYGKRKGLLGIEVLNEPMLKKLWAKMKLQERYIPVDKELAKGSDGTTLEFMQNFYNRAYEIINPNLEKDKFIVIHDCFELTAWKDFWQDKSKYANVILDTHQYLTTAELMGCKKNLDSYLDFIKEHYEKEMEEMSKYFPVICGEWCLFNSLTRELESKEERTKIYRALDKAQKAAWDKGAGWFYWSYKLLMDTVNNKKMSGWEGWDLGRSVDMGWFSTTGQP